MQTAAPIPRLPPLTKTLICFSLKTSYPLENHFSYQLLCFASHGNAHYIQADLSRSFTIEGLAQVAGVSPRHFMRAFRKSTGQAGFSLP
ncbi:AraC-like DNA-binding protein [Rhodoferax ferrireducens]|uniref:AraC-like DNA-binding protein n=1 Tax=Rhodoferax ferrireducens TaxID=192843 RepID=A0ABU2C290_9BURK|nr:AraC family transcriptional regulator [Rhodoferax ferrireducens]MDR7375449.1 AraC-like DNA-binding protein [Rhodoferax ferrireducens]